MSSFVKTVRGHIAGKPVMRMAFGVVWGQAPEKNPWPHSFLGILIFKKKRRSDAFLSAE